MINLKLIRVAKGYTQAKVGEYMGVGSNCVSQWESGKRDPDYESLKKLAKYFGVTVDYLLENNTLKAPENRLVPIVQKVSKIDTELLTDLDTYIDHLIELQKQNKKV